MRNPERDTARAQVIGWMSGYQETLKELGLEDGDIGFPEGRDRGMTLLGAKYIPRMHATLHTWFVNILQVRPRLDSCAMQRRSLTLQCLHHCLRT